MGIGGSKPPGHTPQHSTGPISDTGSTKSSESGDNIRPTDVPNQIQKGQSQTPQTQLSDRGVTRTESVTPQVSEAARATKAYKDQHLAVHVLQLKQSFLESLPAMQTHLQTAAPPEKPLPFNIIYRENGKDISVVPPDPSLSPDKLKELRQKLSGQLQTVEHANNKPEVKAKLTTELKEAKANLKVLESELTRLKVDIPQPTYQPLMIPIDAKTWKAGPQPPQPQPEKPAPKGPGQFLFVPKGATSQDLQKELKQKLQEREEKQLETKPDDQEEPLISFDPPTPPTTPPPTTPPPVTPVTDKPPPAPPISDLLIQAQKNKRSPKASVWTDLPKGNHPQGYSDIYIKDKTPSPKGAIASLNAGTQTLGVGGGGNNGEFGRTLGASANTYQTLHDNIFDRFAALHTEGKKAGQDEGTILIQGDSLDQLAGGNSPVQATLAFKPRAGDKHKQAGAVFIDVFKEDQCPFGNKDNRAMLYVVPPKRTDYPTPEEFLKAVRMTARNVARAQNKYNQAASKDGSQLPQLPVLRACLFSGDIYRKLDNGDEDCTKEQVAAAIKAGFTEYQAELGDRNTIKEIQFPTGTNSFAPQAK